MRQFTHPIAAIAEIQSDLLRRQRASEAQCGNGITLINLQDVQKRLGVALELTTTQEAIDLGIKRLDALMWMSKHYRTAVKHRLAMDAARRRQHLHRQVPALTVVK